MNEQQLFSEEQLDFLCEMMNIGVGNAAVAFTQLLQQEVDVKLPVVQTVPVAQVAFTLDDPATPVVCVKMTMVGDVTGDLFFVVLDEDRTELTRLVQRATPGPNTQGAELEVTVLAEVGNIIAGVCLAAIHDFCKLNIYHTVPTVAIDMVQSLLDQSLSTLSRQGQTMVVIETEFDMASERRFRTFFLLLPSARSLQTLVDSIAQARMAYGADPD